MNVETTPRGFELINHATDERGSRRLVQQSSAVGDDPSDAIDRPGSSMLWIGEAHLSRAEVTELVRHLQAWIETGSLRIEEDGKS